MNGTATHWMVHLSALAGAVLLFAEHRQGHVDFLLKQMKAGRLLYAGPFKDGGGGYPSTR